MYLDAVVIRGDTAFLFQLFDEVALVLTWQMST